MIKFGLKFLKLIRRNLHWESYNYKINCISHTNTWGHALQINISMKQYITCIYVHKKR